MKMEDTILYIVIPCYNEQEGLENTAKVLQKKMQQLMGDNKISYRSRIMFVNDGSKDATWEIIKRLHSENNLFTGISLSRNRGHQNAILAGMITAKQIADAIITMDADLQDDVDVIPQMIDKFLEGNDIVYGVRASRETDTLFKRTTALVFYKLMNWLGVECVYNHADYRLMSKRAVDGLEKFKEVNLFLRGMIPLVGYKSAKVKYNRKERSFGTTKYPLKAMINLALNGITSLSVKPIRIITRLGLIIFLLSLVALIYIVYVKLTGRAAVGWSSIVVSIWLLGGLQLLAIGIIGEYIGKIYLETKHRPRYIIEESLLEENN